MVVEMGENCGGVGKAMGKVSSAVDVVKGGESE